MGLFTSFLSPLFSKVFIAINVDASTCSIKLIRVKNTNILESFTKEFKTSENNIPMDAIKIVRKYRKEYPFTYVSVMIKSLAQGVVLQNDKKIYCLAVLSWENAVLPHQNILMYL